MRFPKLAAAAALIPTLIGCGQPAPSEEVLEVGSKAQAIVDIAGQEAGPFDGWNIMSDTWVKAAGDTKVKIPVVNVDLELPVDGLSLEWDYFMIHDDDFTGVIGYVVADPRGLLGGKKIDLLNLMPSGGNVTVTGEFPGSNSMVADFAAFGLDNLEAGKDERTFSASKDDQFATITPNEAAGTILLEGRTAQAAYSLTVSQDWAADFDAVKAQHGDHAFGPARSSEIGVLKGIEQWTVNMFWPRTKVVGTITELANGKVHNIDGHGYRENSFGRWAFVADGWDFAIASSEDTNGNPLQWTWQTYHLSETLDFVEVMFKDNGELKYERFDGNVGDLGWQHDSWVYDGDVGRCVPDHTFVAGDNGDYRVEVTLNIDDRQIPILSDATWITNLYAIQEHFPTADISVINKSTGAVVSHAENVQAGGEISFLRTDLSMNSSWDKMWMRGSYGDWYCSKKLAGSKSPYYQAIPAN